MSRKSLVGREERVDRRERFHLCAVVKRQEAEQWLQVCSTVSNVLAHSGNMIKPAARLFTQVTQSRQPVAPKKVSSGQIHVCECD